ncbi:hypothetical protein CLIB1423_12S02850 [[Candida] railenensis]|uniref:Vacuolar membrane protein n=1 Tax=[Candida] railenensis TaxID=45579 RepID=A0A9P0VZB5_9ASCO|nr:hypothetical protein CLIB1423_12S02850 [[Candida] railenensis]
MDTYFNPDKQIDRYDLDTTTFDVVDMNSFYNNNFSTILSFLYEWCMLLLALALIGSDIYTCLMILVFHKWGSNSYEPYAYSVAKWIFTGCILFQFVLILYHWIWAIKTFKTRNIALVYVNHFAKMLYTLKSYKFHCLFFKIEQDNFFDWACFLSYNELDNALQVLVADAPRQVINILTLRYYATGEDTSNDIISNIKEIATTNLKLSIILSFMCLSFVIWCIFFFKFCLGMIFFFPVYFGVKKRGYSSLKKYCCHLVNQRVRMLVRKYHKSKKALLSEGILDRDEIARNPLLHSTSTFNGTFDGYNASIDDFKENPFADRFKRSDFEYHQLVPRKDSRSDLTYASDAKLPTTSLNMAPLRKAPTQPLPATTGMMHRSDAAPGQLFQNPFESRENLMNSTDSLVSDSGKQRQLVSQPYEPYRPGHVASQDRLGSGIASNAATVSQSSMPPTKHSYQSQYRPEQFEQFHPTDQESSFSVDTPLVKDSEHFETKSTYSESLLEGYSGAPSQPHVPYSQKYGNSGSTLKLNVGVDEPLPYPARGSSVLDNFDYSANLADYRKREDSNDITSENNYSMDSLTRINKDR